MKLPDGINFKNLPRNKVKIGDLLRQYEIITEDQLNKALEEQTRTGRKLGKVFVDLGFVTEEEITKILAHQLDVPYVDLTQQQPKKDVVKMLPENLARRFRVIPIDRNDSGIVLGMVDPTDIYAYDEISAVLDENIQPVVVKESDLLHIIDLVNQHSDEIKNLADAVSQEVGEAHRDLTDEEMAGISDAPVVKLIQTIFEDAVVANASDIHIEPDRDVLRIRRRIDGVLHEQIMDDKRISPALVSRLKLMASLDISERRLPQDGRFNISIRDKSVDIRISTMPTQYGESAVMRLQDQSSGLLKLGQIGMPKDLQETFRRLIGRPHGIVIVTGPTGSGKTTTLYAALNELNQPQKKIITVEDPVEYRLPRINQVQVNAKIGLDFARVLRTTLRQDPDIILVGEVRDQETAEIALRAAMTGHMVLTTLHTNDAPSSALRLIDMGVEPFLVASAVNGILAQRLVRKICEKCKSEYTPSATERLWLENACSTGGKIDKFLKGKGCNYCHGTGYKGRIGVYELLEVDEELGGAIQRQDFAGFKTVLKNSKKYKPLLQMSIEYIKQGITTIEETMRIAGWVE